jgi:hypothetical protein
MTNLTAQEDAAKPYTGAAPGTIYGAVDSGGRTAQESHDLAMAEDVERRRQDQVRVALEQEEVKRREAEADKDFLAALKVVEDQDRTRLATLRRSGAKLVDELAAAQQRLAKSADTDEEARVRWFRSNVKAPDALSPVGKIVERRRKDQAAVETLTANIAAISLVIAEEAEKQKSHAEAVIRKRVAEQRKIEEELHERREAKVAEANEIARQINQAAAAREAFERQADRAISSI